MAIIWCVCDGSSLECYSVTSSLGSCPSKPTFAGTFTNYSNLTISTTTNVAANLSVDVSLKYYRNTYLVIGNQIKSAVLGTTGPYVVIDSDTIAAGTDSKTFSVPCAYSTRIDIDGYGDGEIDIMELDGATVRNQTTVPTCGSEPAECQLDITGYTSTAPTQRGSDDGSITASVSGMTGSTVTWYLDGAEYTGQTSYEATFSNLDAETYVVRAEEGPCISQQSVVVADGDFRTGDFIVSSPSSRSNIVAVENPVIVEIETAINSINPKLSINEFEITGDISDVTIEFNLTFPYTYSATFYSKGFPDRDNYFLESTLTNSVGTSVGTNSHAEIAVSLAEALENDSILSRLYYVFVDDTTVTMTSKEFNPYYDLSTDNVTITGSNLTLTNSQSGVAEYDGQLSADYSVYTEVFVDDDIEYGETESSLSYRRVKELELPFQSDNIHQFDLSPVLKNFVSSPKLNFAFTGATFMTEMIASYYVKYGEKYPLIANTNTKKRRNKGTGGYVWFINSALDYELPNKMNSYFPGTGTTGNIKFLNTASNSKYSHRDAKEFLNIVVEQDYGYPLAVFADLNMYDGTIYSDIKLFDIIVTGQTTNTGGVAALAVAPGSEYISQYETSTLKIRSIDITVKYSTDGSTWNAYSETKSFRLEIDEQPDNFNIAFLNKFGTYETYTFVGEEVESADISRESYQRPYDINPDGSASGGFEYNSTLGTKYTKTYVLNTGIIDAETFNFLGGLINSNRLYQYDSEVQTYLTIVDQTIEKSSNEDSYSVQIVVKETIEENNVSQ